MDYLIIDDFEEEVKSHMKRSSARFPSLLKDIVETIKDDISFFAGIKHADFDFDYSQSCKKVKNNGDYYFQSHHKLRTTVSGAFRGRRARVEITLTDAHKLFNVHLDCQVQGKHILIKNFDTVDELKDTLKHLDPLIREAFHEAFPKKEKKD